MTLETLRLLPAQLPALKGLQRNDTEVDRVLRGMADIYDDCYITAETSYKGLKNAFSPAIRIFQNVMLRADVDLLLEPAVSSMCLTSGLGAGVCYLSTAIILNSIKNDIPLLIENAQLNEKALKHLKTIIKNDNKSLTTFIDLTIEEYEKNQRLIENVLDKAVPWVLDDLDPATEFDEQIRKRVSNAITTIDDILVKQGLKQGTTEYDEMMISGLYYLSATPPIEDMPGQMNDKIFDLLGGGKFPFALNEFKAFLNTYGGFKVESVIRDYFSSELSAIEAIRNKKGKCTENSKILFAILKMAGFSPFFVEVLPRTDEVKSNLAVQQVTMLKILGMSHLCIGVYIDNKLRLLDVSLFDANASYDEKRILSLRQALGGFYVNEGMGYTKKKQFEKAISTLSSAVALDPIDPFAAYNYGSALFNSGRLDEAEQQFTETIEQKHDFWPAYKGRSEVLMQKGDYKGALSDISSAIKINPNNDDLYFRRIKLCLAKRDLGLVINDFSNVIQYSPTNFSAMFENAQAFLRTIYSTNSELKDIRMSILKDVGIDIVDTEMVLIGIYSLWVAKPKVAKAGLSKVITAFFQLKKPSQALISYYKKILDLMPQDMKEDSDVQAILAEFKRRLNLQ